MITNKKELKFYIKADAMMNTGSFNYSLIRQIIDYLTGNQILQYLRALRHVEYYMNLYAAKRTPINKFLLQVWRCRTLRIGSRLGLSIAPNVFGYGLVIPHYGSVIVGGGNQIGNYALLQANTCIPTGNRKIGEGLYMSNGSKITGDNIELPNFCIIAANSVVTKAIPTIDFCPPEPLFAGMPAKIVRDNMNPWFQAHGERHNIKYQKIEALREQYNLNL